MDGKEKKPGKKLGILSILSAWAVLIAVWQIGSLFYSDDFLPGPVSTFSETGNLIESGVLLQDILISMFRVLKGWILGIVFAVPVGVGIGCSKKISFILDPLLNFFRFVPAIGFVTLFLLWFGVGEKSKVALIFYAVIFPVMVNTIVGVRSVDKSFIEAAQSLGGSKAVVLFKVIIPSAIPNIFTGIRLGLSAAIICIVAAEMLSASEGLGYLIYTARLYYKTDWIFIGIVVLGLIGFLADKLLQLIGKKFLGKYGVI